MRIGWSCSAFNHVFAGLEAYVSAHLADFPGDLQLQATPGGVGGARRASPSGFHESRADRHLRFRPGRPHGGARHLSVPAAASPPSTSAIPPGCPTAPSRPRRCAGTAARSSQWLLEQGVKAVVIACNTSTAHALDVLREESPVPVIGVIEPGARARPRRSGARPDRRDRNRRHHRQQRVRARHPAVACPRPGSSSGPARSSCRWSRRAGSSTRPPS